MVNADHSPATIIPNPFRSRNIPVKVWCLSAWCLKTSKLENDAAANDRDPKAELDGSQLPRRPSVVAGLGFLLWCKVVDVLLYIVLLHGFVAGPSSASTTFQQFWSYGQFVSIVDHPEGHLVGQ